MSWCAHLWRGLVFPRSLKFLEGPKLIIRLPVDLHPSGPNGTQHRTWIPPTDERGEPTIGIPNRVEGQVYDWNYTAFNRNWKG